MGLQMNTAPALNQTSAQFCIASHRHHALAPCIGNHRIAWHRLPASHRIASSAQASLSHRIVYHRRGQQHKIDHIASGPL